jgi:PIN domain nuclease of toxin-antitoxin system
MLPWLTSTSIAREASPFHHRDPFDRLLIAQGLVEHIPIVSVDRLFDTYAVMRLW